jgi:hypothetical protein
MIVALRGSSVISARSPKSDPPARKCLYNYFSYQSTKILLRVTI